jgi:hypothetical protein
VDRKGDHGSIFLLRFVLFRSKQQPDHQIGLSNKAHCRDCQQHEEHQIIRLGQCFHAQAQLCAK